MYKRNISKKKLKGNLDYLILNGSFFCYNNVYRILKLRISKIKFFYIRLIKCL